MKEPGLDNRHRDEDGEIQRKRSDTAYPQLMMRSCKTDSGFFKRVAVFASARVWVRGQFIAVDN